MNRIPARRGLSGPRLCLRFAAAALLAAGTSACSPPEAGPPDVVLVVINTLRADHVGSYGYSRDTTPNIDALADRGRRFERVHAHSGWTLPSMTSLLTGLYPHEHRVGRDPLDPTHFGRLEEGATTLAERLRAVGYRCAAVVNNTFMAPEFGLAQGFDVYDYVGADPRDHRSAVETAQVGLRWLNESDAPAFLLLHFMEPHLEYDPPASVRGTFAGDAPAGFHAAGVTAAWQTMIQPDRSRVSDAQFEYIVALYDEEILTADLGVGLLLDGLRTRGRLDRTLLVVTSDHGEEFFEHGGFEHGHTLFGELTRVPLVMAGPGVEAGIDASLFQHADLFWLLLGLSGAEPGSAEARRYALAENVLYGPPRTTVLSKDSRLSVDLLTQELELWKLDERGFEQQRVSNEAQRAELLAALRSLRGGIEQVRASDGPVLASPEAIEQLKALGYLSGR